MSNKIYNKNFWDERYNTPEYIYGEGPNQFLAENENLIKNNSQILCLSEGEGRNSVYLAKKGHHVTGVDISNVAKQKALNLATRNNVSIAYEVADLKDYDLGSNQWDCIVSIFAHTPSEIRINLHKKIINALKPEGIFILEGYNQEQLKYNTGGPKDINMLYNNQDLELQFKQLKIIRLQNVIRNVQEGTGHTGEASVVQLIAKKILS